MKLNREKQDWLQKNVQDLSQDLKERDESDEWLQSEVDRYEERMAVHEQEKQHQAEQYDSFRLIIDQSRDHLRRKHVEAGKYEEQKANHEKQIEKRKVMIKDTSSCHSIRGYESNLDDMQINEFMERISVLSRDQSAAVEKVRRETEREMQKAQDLLSRLGERKSVLNEGKNSSKQQTAANDRKIGACQSELNKIEIDEGGKAVLEANIEDLEARLQKAKDECRAGLWDKRIQESNVQLRTLEEENDQLNRDLVQGTKQAGDLARLDYLKTEIADRQRSIDKMKGVHNVAIQAVVDQSWQPSSLEAEFHRVIDKKNRELKEAERQRDVVSRSLEQVDFKLSVAQTDLRKGEKERDSCAKRLRENVEGEPEEYLTTLAEIQNGRDILKADSDNFENQRTFFLQAIRLAREQHKCKLCTRVFHATTEQEAFLKSMEAKIAKEKLAETQQELEDQEEFLRLAKEVGPSHDNWVRLCKTELPRLGSEISRLSTERSTILRDIEDQDKLVKDHEESKRDVDALMRPVASIVKYHQEMNSFAEQTQELVAKQKDTGQSRNLDDIQVQLELVGGKSRGIRNSIATLTTNKERARSLVATLELDLSKAKNNHSTASHQLDKKADISTQIEDMRNGNQEYRNTVRLLDEQLQDLAPQIAEGEAKIEDVRQRGSEREKTLQEEASRLSDSVNRLKLAEHTIQAYIDDGGPAKLARCQREIETAQQDIRHTEEEQKQVIMSINKISEELRNHQETKRSIVENIKYRRSVRELETVKMEIAKLSAQNAEADQEHWQRQASRWQSSFTELSTQKTSKLGSAKAKDDQLAQLIEDWNTDYKDAAFKFKKAHIEVEVNSYIMSLPNLVLTQA